MNFAVKAFPEMIFHVFLRCLFYKKSHFKTELMFLKKFLLQMFINNIYNKFKQLKHYALIIVLESMSKTLKILKIFY